MQHKATTPDEYIAQLSEDRGKVISKLRKIILQYIPKGVPQLSRRIFY